MIVHFGARGTLPSPEVLKSFVQIAPVATPPVLQIAPQISLPEPEESALTKYGMILGLGGAALLLGGALWLKRRRR